MSTEVVVHDDSIKDVVPGEPMSYQEAVRRAVEDATSGCQPNSSGSANSIDTDQVTWVRIGARMPPGRRRCRPDDDAEQEGREGQHDVAGRGRGDGVGERGPGDRAAG